MRTDTQLNPIKILTVGWHEVKSVMVVKEKEGFI